MLNNGRSEKYSRQLILSEVGTVGQEKLAKTKVLIVGMGGLGCPAAQYLAAAGVGTLGLMDHDTVQSSNLHRQILFTDADIGKSKAIVASKFLQKRYSDIRFNTIEKRLSEENAMDLFSEYDLIIDGSDNFQTKYLINDACVLTDTSWVYASIYKFQGQISVFNYNDGPTYRCLFPVTTARGISCEDTGVIGVLPGVLGTLQAAEAIKMILGKGEVLSGKLKIIDLLGHQDQMMRFQRNEEQVKKIKKRGLISEIIHCELESEEHFYLDVREPYEEPKVVGKNVLALSMDQLIYHHHKIPKDCHVHVFCKSGIRSKKAIELLENNFGFSNLVHVDNGIQSIIKKN